MRETGNRCHVDNQIEVADDEAGVDDVITAMLAKFLQSLDEALIPMDDDLELAWSDDRSMLGDDEAASPIGAAATD